MAINLTQVAADRVKSFLDSRGKGLGLRIGIKTTGCSGMAYVLEFVDELQDGDEVFETRGVKVIVDAKSLVYLDGTEVDFAKEGLQHAQVELETNDEQQQGNAEIRQLLQHRATVETQRIENEAGCQKPEQRWQAQELDAEAQQESQRYPADITQRDGDPLKIHQSTPRERLTIPTSEPTRQNGAGALQWTELPVPGVLPCRVKNSKDT